MRAPVLIGVAIGALAIAAPASAQQAELGYPRGALGYEALASDDLTTAEAQLKSGAVAQYDPARLINIGQVYARTGRLEKAERMFVRAQRAEEVELVLADGRTVSSAEAAERALQLLRAGYFRR
jgi:tetratricopeptide (TPR) repeat protein